MKNVFLAIALVFGFASLSSAQGVNYPGTIWSSVGNLSIVETGNVQSITHVEQGVAYKGAELFGLLTGQTDRLAYDWNRRLTTGAGVRFTQSIKTGSVRAAVAYVNERRYVVPANKSGFQFSVDAWFGWNQK